MFKKNDFVRISRLGNLKEGNQPGLPAGYTIEGFVAEDPVAGDTFKVFRTKRNGARVPGLFESSYLLGVTDTGFITENSIYTVEVIPTTEEDQLILDTMKHLRV